MTSESGISIARVPALDGLRGLAVAAVVANHLRPSALRGGWLGVDVFFVLSGYLITTLLLREHTATGAVDLRHFYSRRARRLLPALFLLLAVVAIVMRVAPDTVGSSGVRGDGFAALGYVANWHFIASGASYFNAFAPSPLRHLWSLSVEEQFYFVWPIVLIVVIRRYGSRGVGIVAALLAVASAIAMAFTFGNGAHASRVYFGTDTRAHGILLGCVVAVIGSRMRGRLPYSRVVALVALAGIALAVVRIDGAGPAAYRGGIAGVGALTAVLILALTASGTRGPAGWMLERKPIAALGLVSYGLYLWHWPVIGFVTAERVHLSGVPLLAVQLGIALALTIASFLLIERPALSGWPKPRVSWIALPAAVAAAAVALVIVAPSIQTPFAVADEVARARSPATAPVASIALNASSPARAAPRRVVLVGDSVAYTLFPGLVAREHGSDLYFLNAAQRGCPLDVSVRATRNGNEAPRPVRLSGECQWTRAWPAMINRANPHVVVAMWGLWDLYDIEVGDTWLDVGSPQWFAEMERTLDHALDILTARGARVVILTTPYLVAVSGERVEALNRVFRTVAAARPSQVAIVDTKPAIDFLKPERWDSIHFSVRGAGMLGRVVVPIIADIAHAGLSRRPEPAACFRPAVLRRPSPEACS